ncbi:MAG TPA: DegT/DnrJ/EryC1/StrS family aminotransferase [Candidatus Dormibacteraeota bacterium]|jgi:dTDP-4-amino-4,6-dideoxygalactose transaminase
MDELIPVFKPHIGIETAKAAVAALDLGWLGMGSYVGEFERGLESYLGLTGRRVVAVNTGTSALHLAMLVTGVGPGDEVITPSFNNIGDLQAIRAVGADPVFCDIRNDNLGIDVAKAEALVSPRTKVVIGMDYAGIPCDLDNLHAMAGRHRLRVVHDAAHSLGSRHGGKPIGSVGDIVIFSFDAVKTLTCIDGGALVVNSEGEVEQLHRLRFLGTDQSPQRLYTNNRSWTYDVAGPGFRYHLANLHASIGLSQLSRLDEFVATRQRACRLYSDLLGDVDGLTLPATDFRDVAPFIYYVRVLNGRRDALKQALLERGVDTGIHWIPGHQFSFFKDCRGGDLSVTERIGSEILTLPLHSFMEVQTVERVAAAISASLRMARAA